MVNGALRSIGIKNQQAEPLRTQLFLYERQRPCGLFRQDRTRTIVAIDVSSDKIVGKAITQVSAKVRHDLINIDKAHRQTL